VTPATILAGIPDGLLRRRANPDAQLENAKALAVWLAERGHRPSLAEIEAERARRTTTNERTHRRVIRRSTQPKEN
jgi:hypothetical protein